MAEIKIVIGANYGDEGKGLMTDYFCHQSIKKNESCLVVCTNGGAQRGHTVTTQDGQRHVFHHFGSGTLSGADTYLSEEFILNPIIFREEYEELNGDINNIYVDLKCRISTPYDMIANQILEEARGDNRHGSCGIGIWETILRCKDSYCYKFYDLLYDTRSETERWLENVKRYFEKERLKYIPHKWKDIWNSTELFHNYINDMMFFKNHVIKEKGFNIPKYDTVIFENAQGLLIDKKYGDHSTPTSTGIEVPKSLINKYEYFKGYDIEVCYVTRTYLTRHGNGLFPTEFDKIPDWVIKDKTNVFNKNQGKLRYGELDYIELKERILEDFDDGKSLGNKCVLSLAVTHTNEYSNKEINKIFYAPNTIYLSFGETNKSMMVYKSIRGENERYNLYG